MGEKGFVRLSCTSFNAQILLHKKFWPLEKSNVRFLNKFWNVLTFLKNCSPESELMVSMGSTSCEKLLCANSYAQLLCKNLWPSEMSIFWFLVRFFWVFFFFSNTTQSAIKDLIKATGWEKPPGIRCYPLKFGKNASGKNPKSQNFSLIF